MKTERINENEKGAIIVEASIALPIFMFAMMMLLFVVQVSYAQARIAVATDRTAKEMAKYTYMYYALGLNDTLEGEEGASQKIANKVSEVMTALGEKLNITILSKGGEALNGDSLVSYIREFVAYEVAEDLFIKNLVGDKEKGEYEKFKRMNQIVGDISFENKSNKEVGGISLGGSSYMGDGSKYICLNAKYKIRIIPYLPVKYSTFQMGHCAYASIWGGD